MLELPASVHSLRVVRRVAIDEARNQTSPQLRSKPSDDYLPFSMLLLELLLEETIIISVAELGVWRVAKVCGLQSKS